MRLKPFVRGPIAARLFIFNILLVFLPVAGFFSLAAYESSLLSALEHALSQQGRILSAWLSSTGVEESSAIASIVSLRQRHTARIRVVDSRGRLLADSAVLGTAVSELPSGTLPQTYRDSPPGTVPEDSGSVASEETLVYRVLSWPVRVWRRYFLPPAASTRSMDYYAEHGMLEGKEIQAALNGRYGAMTRVGSSLNPAVTLYTAVPIEQEEKVVGAVLVSQSTFRILIELYALRLEIGKVFLLSSGAAALLSLMLASTISVPLVRLRKLASGLVGSDARLENRFGSSGRGDEIDFLARSLDELLERLRERVNWAERFSADAAHELRNPIAAVKTAAELLPDSGTTDRTRLINAIVEGVGRMERIVSGLRQLSVIDSGEGETSALILANVLASIIEGIGKRFNVEIRFEAMPGSERLHARIDPERLEIVMGNLLENACSFAVSSVVVTLCAEEGFLRISVADDGPGIPSEHRARVFDRFFSWRPSPQDHEHAGLGLSMVKAVIERSGGSVRLDESSRNGACFIVRLPIAHTRR